MRVAPAGHRLKATGPYFCFPIFLALLSQIFPALGAAPVGPTSLTGWGRNDFGQSTVPTNLTDVISVAAGRNFAVAVRADGSVVGWGELSEAWTNLVSDLHDVVAVDAFYYSGIFLRANGTVFAFSPTGPLPEVLPEVTNAVAVAVGNGFALALRADGTVASSGTSDRHAVPPGLVNVIAIAAGAGFSLALTGEGRVVAWGNNEYGQTDVPSDLKDVVAIDAGFRFALALRRDGIVVGWGDNDQGQLNIPVTTGPKTIAIFAGGFHSLVVWENRVVWAAGLARSGQTSVPPGLSNVLMVAAGTYNNIALLNDGRPHHREAFTQRLAYPGSTAHLDGRASGLFNPQYQWRFNGEPLPNQTRAFLTLSNVSAADAGLYAVTAFSGSAADTAEILLQVEDSPPLLTGKVSPPRQVPLGFPVVLDRVVQGSRPATFQWFHNGVLIPSETNISLTVSNVSRSHEGDYVLQACNAFGSATNLAAKMAPVPLVTWGDALSNEINADPVITNLVDIASSESLVVGLTGEGKVLAWGSSLDGEAIVPPAATNITGIAAGVHFGVAVSEKGTVLQWGKDIGTSHLALTNVVAVAAGYDHGLAVLGDGRVRAFGTAAVWGVTNIPPNLTNIVAVACGRSFNMALNSSGWVSVWDGYGEITNIPSNLDEVIAVAAADGHALALKKTGAVVAWGGNGFGESSVPPELGEVIGIAAGSSHSLAVRRDGGVSAWGLNAAGQCNVPSFLHKGVRVKAGRSISLALLDDDTAQWHTELLLEPAKSGDTFAVSVHTRRGNTYWLESARTPRFDSSTLLRGVAGNGSIVTFTDTNTTAGYQFYRLLRR